MSRYEVIHKHKNFTIEYDNQTHTYMCFQNLGMFKQQVSKNYRYLGCCVREFNRIVFQ